jgi:hypothetical protein
VADSVSPVELRIRCQQRETLHSTLGIELV